jgi:hypothetical protein
LWSIARGNMSAACVNLRRVGGLLAAVYSEPFVITSGLWGILLQKSPGSVGAIFSGLCRCLSKKYVGVHSTDRSRNQGLPQQAWQWQ